MCVSCPAPPTCTCTSSQTCFLRAAASCNECITSHCEDIVSGASSSSGGSSSSIGTTAGAAVGGILGLIGLLGLAYWFWWKPRGLSASRKRYSQHLAARQSKFLTPEKGSTLPTRRASGRTRGTEPEDLFADRDEGAAREDSEETDRPPTPNSAMRSGLRTQRKSALDNPFGDHARSSRASFDSGHTSDYSFRSSQSTNIIPIAYMPPHSASLSVEDANRGPLGEIDGNSKLVGVRSSVPVSIGSMDSADDHYIDLPVLPIALSSHHPRQSPVGAAPARPPRLPGLDLQLPPPSSGQPSSELTETLRPGSGFAWSNPTSSSARPGLTSAFSSSQTTTNNDNRLAPFSRDSRPISTFSTLSAGTSRSGNSTMSYILDPPRIITPSNAQGLRRVEVLGSRQAGLVTLVGSNSHPVTPTSASLLSPGSDTPFLSPNPFADPSPSTSSFVRSNSTRFSSSAVGGGTPLSSHYEDDRPDSVSVASMSARDSFNSDPARWTGSSEDRVVGVEDGEYIESPGSPGALTTKGSRSNLMSSRTSIATTAMPGSPVRSSVVHGIQPSPRSPVFPLPPLRTSLSSPLPAPFLPFAGQRPSIGSTRSTAGSTNPTSQRVTSANLSLRTVRSGFGSGLDGIPFQLGFPGGIDDGASDRGSMISTRGSGGGGGAFLTGGEVAGEFGASAVSLAVSESDSFVTAAPSMHSRAAVTKRSSGQSFSQATVSDLNHGTSQSRLSVDDLALSAQMARTLSGDL